MLYKNIDIDNLSIIQKECLPMIEKDLHVLPHNILTALDTERYMNVPSLKSALDSLGLTEYVALIGVTRCAEFSSYIHVDDLRFKYSLNIPITGGAGSFFNVYKAKDGIPEHGTETYKTQACGNVIKFGKFEDYEVDLVEHNERTQAALVSVSTPHQYENPESHTSIIMMVRLTASFEDLQRFFKKY